MGRKEECKKGAPEWMTTFSDLMSLLLCFFVLLFSLSVIEKVRFEQTISSIQGALGRIPNMFNTSFTPPDTIEPQRVEPVQREKDIERAKEAITVKARSKLVAEEPSKEVIVEGVKEGLRISLAGRVLFEPGVFRLSEEGQRLVRTVAEELILPYSGLQVRIEGHTDDDPIDNATDEQNNWRLAERRAFSVLQFLRDDMDVPEERMSYMSCGQYRPRFPNDSIENRALNRRVEIVLLMSSSSESIMGVLEGSGDPTFIPELSEFVPQGQ